MMPAGPGPGDLGEVTIHGRDRPARKENQCRTGISNVLIGPCAAGTLAPRIARRPADLARSRGVRRGRASTGHTDPCMKEALIFRLILQSRRGPGKPTEPGGGIRTAPQPHPLTSGTQSRLPQRTQPPDRGLAPIRRTPAGFLPRHLPRPSDVTG